LECYNEITIALSMGTLIFFTDSVESATAKKVVGKILIGVIVVHIAGNWILFVSQAVIQVYRFLS